MAVRKLESVKDYAQIVADQMYIMESYVEGALYIGNGIDIVQHLFDHIGIQIDVQKITSTKSQNKQRMRDLWMQLNEDQMDQLDQQFNIFKRF